MKKKLKFILISLLVLLIMAAVIFFLSKDWLVGKAISKVQLKLKDKYGLELTFGSHTLEGWNKLVVKNIHCLTPQQDTLAYLELASVEVKMLPVLRGKIHLKEMFAENGRLNLTHIKQLKRKKTEEKPGKQSKFDKIRKYASYFEEMTDALPNDLEVRNLSVAYSDSAENVNGIINRMRYKDENAAADIKLNLNGAEQDWKIEGTFDKRSKKTKLNIESGRPGFLNITKIREKAKGDIGARKIIVELDEFELDEDEITLEGKLAGEEVLFYSEPVSKDSIAVDAGALAFKVIIDKNSIRVDNNSKLTLNMVSANIGADYKLEGPRQLSLKLDMPPVPAQDLLNSLPRGTFDKVRTMKMEGKFSYKLSAFQKKGLDKENDSVFFDSDLDGFDLKITDHGEAQLNKLNTAFAYKPYNSNRRIITGEENPDFTPIDQISDYLKESVNISEDGMFYSHKGFNEEAFAKSIVDNLKAGRFRRGGSTISMQLVKNVFLSHEKAIDRKMEEAMMVWLIENMRLAPKKRMYEVYLNVIEWGPGVYGIGEASRYYFNKHPSRLNLNESIFLALIIPSPRSYKYKFDDQGNLKEYIKGYYNLVSGKLLRRGVISEEEKEALVPNVSLSGKARDNLIIKMPSDSLEKEEPEMEKKWWQELFK